jgi:hypothetical protein
VDTHRELRILMLRNHGVGNSAMKSVHSIPLEELYQRIVQLGESMSISSECWRQAKEADDRRGCFMDNRSSLVMRCMCFLDLSTSEERDCIDGAVAALLCATNDNIVAVYHLYCRSDSCEVFSHKLVTAFYIPGGVQRLKILPSSSGLPHIEKLRRVYAQSHSGWEYVFTADISRGCDDKASDWIWRCTSMPSCFQPTPYCSTLRYRSDFALKRRSLVIIPSFEALLRAGGASHIAYTCWLEGVDAVSVLGVGRICCVRLDCGCAGVAPRMTVPPVSTIKNDANIISRDGSYLSSSALALRASVLVKGLVVSMCCCADGSFLIVLSLIDSTKNSERIGLLDADTYYGLALYRVDGMKLVHQAYIPRRSIILPLNSTSAKSSGAEGFLWIGDAVSVSASPMKSSLAAGKRVRRHSDGTYVRILQSFSLLRSLSKHSTTGTGKIIERTLEIVSMAFVSHESASNGKEPSQEGVEVLGTVRIDDAECVTSGSISMSCSGSSNIEMANPVLHRALGSSHITVVGPSNKQLSVVGWRRQSDLLQRQQSALLQSRDESLVVVASYVGEWMVS